MKPMGLISTPFITFRDIKVKDIDLLEDAMGLNTEFNDVITVLRFIKNCSGEKVDNEPDKTNQESS